MPGWAGVAGNSSSGDKGGCAHRDIGREVGKKKGLLHPTTCGKRERKRAREIVANSKKDGGLDQRCGAVRYGAVRCGAVRFLLG